LLCLSLWLPAQDVHFSQFHNAPQVLNPALTAAFKADHRLAANYRTQWSSVPVPYETLSADYSRKLALPFEDGHHLGIGGSFLYDQAGDGQLTWLQIALRAALHWQLEDGHQISAGLQARVGQRTLQQGAFQFGDQFTDNFFDPQAASAEDLNGLSSGFASLGAGLNWHYRDNYSRTQLWAGIGSDHLNRPVIRFLENNDTSVPIRLNVHAMGDIEMNDLWDLSLRFLVQNQGSYREFIGLAGARYHLTDWVDFPLAVQLSSGYRWADAAIVMLEVYYAQWQFGLSYDINTSPFQNATNRRGGLELSVAYFITEVKPPKGFKACPIF
jgi:type IX secretion system PorP/SprF family membrane protein